MNRGSFKIGSVMGIPILIHFTFLLILPFVAWAIGQNIQALARIAGMPASNLSLQPYALGLLIALALFASVILHELGHSFVALRKGIRIRGITLMLFGGVAQLEDMPTRAWEEAKIALAGPVVSLVVGACCVAVVPALGRGANPDLSFALSYVGYLNLMLGVFNLLPAFPMDGGRILRSVLARWTSHLTATRIATTVGKAFAVLFGLVGLFWGDVFLVIVAFFVYIGASQEEQFTAIRFTLDGLRVRDIMTSKVSTVTERTPLPDLLDKMFDERHSGYPVVEAGELVGCVTQEDIEKIPAEQRESATVAGIMTTELVTVAPEDDAYLALKRMNEADVGRLPVLNEGALVGLITRSDVLGAFRLRRLGRQAG